MGIHGKKKLLPPCHSWVARPFPSFPKPLFQRKAKRKAGQMKRFCSWPRYESRGFWNLQVACWAMSSWWGELWIPVEQNNPGYLKEFLVHNFSFSRLISKYGNVFLQFTTARLITIYDNVLLQFLIAWLLQFSTTVITIYEKYYNFRKVLRFTTEQGALQGFWITYKFLLTWVCRNFLYGRPDVCF